MLTNTDHEIIDIIRDKLCCSDVAVDIALAIKDKTAWQPIDTAPKDGRALLLWCVGILSEPFHCVGIFDDGAWFDVYEHAQLADPTHWMPLPEPPKTDA